MNVKNLHAVDVVSIGTKNNLIPLKEVNDELISGYEGKYCGHNSVISAQKNDTFEVKLEERLITTSRWAMCEVRQELRNRETCKENDHRAQFCRKHCGATIISGVGADTIRTIPSEELEVSEDEDKPVIGVRAYFGGASAVLVNLA